MHTPSSKNSDLRLCRSSRIASAAFSLIETTLSLAIASMGFVTLLGLLPQGLEMVRRSSDLSTKSRITRQISAELNTAPSASFAKAGYSSNRYFNDQGVEISGDDPFLSYVAAVHVPETSQDVRLPSGTAGAASANEGYLRRIHVLIVNTADKNFNFEAALVNRVVTDTAVTLAQLGE